MVVISISTPSFSIQHLSSAPPSTWQDVLLLFGSMKFERLNPHILGWLTMHKKRCCGLHKCKTKMGQVKRVTQCQTYSFCPSKTLKTSLFWFNHVRRTLTHQLLQPRNLVPFNSLSWELDKMNMAEACRGFELTPLSWRGFRIFPINVMMSKSELENLLQFSTYFCFGPRYVPKMAQKSNSDMWSNIQNLHKGTEMRWWHPLAKRHLGTQCDHQLQWPDLGFRCSTLRCDLQQSAN